MLVPEDVMNIFLIQLWESETGPGAHLDREIHYVGCSPHRNSLGLITNQYLLLFEKEGESRCQELVSPD